MKNLIRRMALLAIGCVFVSSGAAARESTVTAGLDIASAYVDRGETLSDSLVVQPYMELESGGLAIGVWGNVNSSDDEEPGSWQFSEIELYIFYTAEFNRGEFSAGYLEYTFPGQEEKAEREIEVSAELDRFLNPSLLAAYGVGGGINGDLYAEAGIGREIPLNGGFTLLLDAAVGYLKPDEGASGFSHYTAGAGAGYGPVTARVAYTGRIDEDVLGDDYDVSFVWMLSVSREF